MSLRNHFGILSFAFGCVATVGLSTQIQAATCTTAPASVASLSIEQVLTLTNILTTLTPNVPANVLAGITSGGQEVRNRIIYNPTVSTVTVTTFTVATGSPNPTPIGLDITPSQLQSYTLNVDKVYTSCNPTPSILFVGTLNSTNGPFGNYSGAPGAVSLGYTTDASPKLNNVVEVIAGNVVAYSASANGTVTFPPLPPPSSGPSGAPTIILSPAPPTTGSIQVFFNPFQVSAAGSTDPANLALTYTWTSDKPASFGPSPNVANPLITFQSGASDYKITVTVTNSAGVSATQTFILTYINK